MFLLPSVSLFKEHSGYNILIGIKGKKEEIERYFNGIYNFNGCPSFTEIEWLGTCGENGSTLHFARFQTNEARFLECLYNQNVFFLTYPDKKENKEIRKKARVLADQAYENIRRDRYLTDKISEAAVGW